jgi:DNA-binding transcriptional LysR family regulator
MANQPQDISASSHLHVRLGTLRQLEIFIRVAECGGISSAAEQLHLTQPTVSMQIKKLSESIGAELYEQIGRKIFLTPAGHIVLKGAREIFDSVSRLDMELKDLMGLKAGKLQLAVVNTAQYFIPHLLGPFSQQYPDIEIELKIGNRSQILERLYENRDDLYWFSDIPEDMDIESIPFLPNPLIVIAPENHPLARKKKISWAELVDERFIMREKGSGTRLAIDQHLASQGMSLNHSIVMESNEAIKRAVRSGMGLAILSMHALAQGEARGVTQLDVCSFPIKEHWNIVYLKQKKFSVVAKTFFDFVINEGWQTLEKAGVVLPELRKLMIRR